MELNPLVHTKLNRLFKIDFDLENRIETLKKEKNEVLSALRGKINLTQNSKRQIIQSPTPRKLKRIPPSRRTAQLQATCKTTNTVQETPKTSKRRRLFYLDPPECKDKSLLWELALKSLYCLELLNISSDTQSDNMFMYCLFVVFF